jgi:hypothetical protein
VFFFACEEDFLVLVFIPVLILIVFSFGAGIEVRGEEGGVA